MNDSSDSIAPNLSRFSALGYCLPRNWSPDDNAKPLPPCSEHLIGKKGCA